MKGASTSPWNEAVLDILTDRLMKELDNKRPSPFPKKSWAYWEAAIHKTFCRIKQEWSRVQPHRTNTGCIKEADETEEHRNMYTDKTLKRIRVQERRVRVRFNSLPMTGGWSHLKKYDWCLMIAQGIAEMKEAAEENDANIWRWLVDVLERLGENGMSSDESGVENEIETIYHIKMMPWRRNIVTELQIIDDQWLVDIDIFTPRGSKPVKRRWGIRNIQSSRKAVANLPHAFYNEWLERQPPKFHAGIPDEKFKWYSIHGCRHT